MLANALGGLIRPQTEFSRTTGKLIAQSIVDSKTAFEQYHAVLAADKTVVELDADDKEAIKAAIKK